MKRLLAGIVVLITLLVVGCQQQQPATITPEPAPHFSDATPFSERSMLVEYANRDLTSTVRPYNYAPPIRCGSPCIVGDELGGGVLMHRIEGIDLLNSHTPVWLVGSCASACTLMLMEARPNVCIASPSAELLIHQAHGVMHNHPDHWLFMPIRYPPDIQYWIDTHGGEPEFEPPLVMRGPDLYRFFPACTSRASP